MRGKEGPLTGWTRATLKNEDAFFMKLGGHVGSLITFTNPIHWFSTDSVRPQFDEVGVRAMLLLEVMRYTPSEKNYDNHPWYEMTQKCEEGVAIVASHLPGKVLYDGACGLPPEDAPQIGPLRTGPAYTMRCFLEGKLFWFYAWKSEIIFL